MVHHHLEPTVPIALLQDRHWRKQQTQARLKALSFLEQDIAANCYHSQSAYIMNEKHDMFKV